MSAGVERAHLERQEGRHKGQSMIEYDGAAPAGKPSVGEALRGSAGIPENQVRRMWRQLRPCKEVQGDHVGTMPSDTEQLHPCNAMLLTIALLTGTGKAQGMKEK